MGDGVLLYPGRQLDGFTEHSVGLVGVLPSIRLKNLRRGVEDAGYLELARRRARVRGRRRRAALLPRVLAEAPAGSPAAWSERGARFFEARRALAALVSVDAQPAPAAVGARSWARARPTAPSGGPRASCACGTSWASPPCSWRSRPPSRGALSSAAEALTPGAASPIVSPLTRA